MMTGKQSELGPTQTLASFAAKTRFEDLPGEVVHDTKRIILDTIGCGIGGYSLSRGKIVAELARDLGGRPEATVFVTGDKVSAVNAAFANADLANVLDLDETFLHFCHFANTIVAAALAVGERAGATGKDLVTAIAVGFDVTARIGLSMLMFKIVGTPPNEKVQLATATGTSFAVPGAAVTAGKILGFSSEKMAHALGLAGANATLPSQTKLLSRPHSMLKYAGYGFMVYTGILAALLAEKGYTGDTTILDGDLGFWRFTGSMEVNWDILLGDLGKKWWILEDAIKVYPACRYLSAGLDLFYKIKREHKIKAEEIESVTFGMHAAAMACKPLAEPSYTPDPKDPDTPYNLSHNAPFLISLAALDIKPSPAWLSPERLVDPRVGQLMKKVKIEPYPEAFKEVMRAIKEEPTKRFKKCPAFVRVVARGQTFDARANSAMGDPWSPETRMSDDQLKDKFRTCCNNIIPQAKAEKAIESIYKLEKLDNIAKLTELLTA